MSEEMLPVEIDEFMHAQKVCRIACRGEDEVYVIPVMFAWHDQCVFVYTTEGKKVELMRKDPVVCVEIDELDACGGWRSVVVHGVYDELGDEAARQALSLIAARHRSDSGDHEEKRTREVARGDGRAPIAFRIRALRVTGRKVVRT